MTRESDIAHPMSHLGYLTLFHASDPVIWVDETGKIDHANPSACRRFGYTDLELCGMTIFDLDANSDEGRWRDDSKRRRNIREEVYETQFHTKDGLKLPVEITFAFMELDGLPYSCYFVRDVSLCKRTQVLRSKARYLQEELKRELIYGEIIGESSALQRVFSYMGVVAGTDSTVLLLGETGTGKELVARAIHQTSHRKDEVLIKVNCGALPASLAESELFGHEKGAFTGAGTRKRGRFELAHRGTLFLDEVGELPHAIQIKLLRVLQEQEFERIGGEETLKVDIRVIAATNKDLEKAVEAGDFREDLYYRLNIFPIKIPPLRDRLDDIPRLVEYLVGKISLRIGKRVECASPDVIDLLAQSDWPGNVRELANVLERAVILCQERELQPHHIIGLRTAPVADADFPTLAEMERQHILAALGKTEGVLSGPGGAAALLKINRSTLWSRIQKLGIRMTKTMST